MLRHLVFRLLVILPLAATLASCGQATLLDGVTVGAGTSATIHPNGGGEAVSISYRIGQPATVSVTLMDDQGQRYPLRENVTRSPSAQPYSLHFDGTVRGADPSIVQRVLPNGTYRYIVAARAIASGQTAEQGGTIEIRDAATAIPTVEEARVEPAVVSPNEDAIDDVATFSYRLPITATVSIAIQNPTETIPFITDVIEGPYEQSHIWDGKRADGSLLASGVYTYTITAHDQVGNIVTARGNVTIDAPGHSEAQIIYFHLAPTEVELGGIITATIKVKNTGTVPIRTQGPGSGYLYSTNQIFSSIEQERWAAKGGGFWRVAIGYDGGPGYPFRWALSARPMVSWAEPGQSDLLNPGEEVTVIGTIRIEERQTKLYFFAGLAHEGVGYPVNCKGITLIKVGF